MGLEKENCRVVRMTRDTEDYHEVFIRHVIVLLSLHSSYYQDDQSEFLLGSSNGKFEKSKFFLKKAGQIIGKHELQVKN